MALSFLTESQEMFFDARTLYGPASAREGRAGLALRGREAAEQRERGPYVTLQFFTQNRRISIRRAQHFL